MKSHIIKIGYIILCLLSPAIGLAQSNEETICSFKGNNIVTVSKFGGRPATSNYKNTVPSISTGTTSVISKNGKDYYRVNLHKYKGNQNKKISSNVIDIMQHSKILLQIKDPAGWLNINDHLKNQFSITDRFICSHVGEKAIALIFTGYSAPGKTPLLTIVLLNNNKAALVYNKPMSICELKQTEDSFSMTVQSQSGKHKIWSENGTLKFENLPKVSKKVRTQRR